MACCAELVGVIYTRPRRVLPFRQLMAGSDGIEPSMQESNSCALPLGEPPIIPCSYCYMEWYRNDITRSHAVRIRPYILSHLGRLLADTVGFAPTSGLQSASCLAGKHLRLLGHVSMAEAVGFEPTPSFPALCFQDSSLWPLGYASMRQGVLLHLVRFVEVSCHWAWPQGRKPNFLRS